MSYFLVREHKPILRRRFYTVQLHASNGEPLTASEPYTTKAAALDGITALQVAASTTSDVRFESV